MASAVPPIAPTSSATAPSVVATSQNWLRGNLIGELCLTDALLTILHNKNNDGRFVGLPEDGAKLHAKMVAFKQNIRTN